MTTSNRPCPNCQSISHKRCCSRCHKVIRGKWATDGHEFCSRHCQREQAFTDKMEARAEIAAATATKE